MKLQKNDVVLMRDETHIQILMFNDKAVSYKIIKSPKPAPSGFTLCRETFETYFLTNRVGLVRAYPLKDF